MKSNKKNGKEKERKRQEEKQKGKENMIIREDKMQK